MTRLEELTKGVTESVTNYAYDNRGYLTKVSSEEGTLATYISRADGLLEQVTDGAGNVTKYQYDSKKLVIGLIITAADGSVLYSEANTYDGNGSLLNQNINGTDYKTESLTYTYDALDRLLSETKNGATTSYTYDVMGNRLTKTSGEVTTSYTYDPCNKLLSETTGEEETTYSYDALGNLTEKVNSTGTTTYAYDALNQLTKVTNPDGTWQSNTYDASGIRSMITENGITTEFMTFNGLVLSGYDKTGEQTEHYYYGNSLIAAEYANNTYTDLYYYLKNSHGDIIGLTDTYSTLTEAYRYDAFGTLTYIKSLNGNGVLAEAETALSRFLYAGEQLDTTTGLYYLRARQYDTVLGRFTQEDTYLGDGRNLYVYVRNNPLKYVDPSGHGKQDTNDIQEDENEKKKYPNPIDLLPWVFLVDLPSFPDINPLGSFGGSDLLEELKFGGDAETIYDSVNSINATNDNSEKSGRGGGRASARVRGGGERKFSDRNTYERSSGKRKFSDRNIDGTSGRKSVEESYSRNLDSTGANRQGDQNIGDILDFSYVDSTALNHSSIGDFTYNPKTGEVSKMKGGGHGQANINFLEENNMDYNILYEYNNGVRIGNVPEHKVVTKRTGTNQSWFPASWTEEDIVAAGEYVANLPGNAGVADGVVVYGEYNGVRIGVIRTNGRISTIFPDATLQP